MSVCFCYPLLNHAEIYYHSSKEMGSNASDSGSRFFKSLPQKPSDIKKMLGRRKLQYTRWANLGSGASPLKSILHQNSTLPCAVRPGWLQGRVDASMSRGLRHRVGCDSNL